MTSPLLLLCFCLAMACGTISNALSHDGKTTNGRYLLKGFLYCRDSPPLEPNLKYHTRYGGIYKVDATSSNGSYSRVVGVRPDSLAEASVKGGHTKCIAGIEAHIQLGSPTKAFCPCKSTATCVSSSDTESEYGDVQRVECERKRMELFTFLSKTLEDMKTSSNALQVKTLLKDITDPMSSFDDYVIRYYNSNVEPHSLGPVHEETSNTMYVNENENKCPICLGEPGNVPYVTPFAVLYALAAAKVFGCTLNKELKFDRKVYQYGDLPKNYQITQTLSPIGNKGYITLGNGKRIYIKQIQLEEDTAKKAVDPSTSDLFYDYNRCGIALVEVITEAAEMTQSEIMEACTLISQRVVEAGICNGFMHRGNIRFDINLSLPGENNGRIEIKNLNSFHRIKRAVAQFLNAANRVRVKTGSVPKGNGNSSWNELVKELTGKDVTINVATTAPGSVTLGWNTNEKRLEYLREKYSCDIEPEPNIPVLKMSDDLLNKIVQFFDNGKREVTSDVAVKYEGIHPDLIKVIQRHCTWESYFNELLPLVTDPKVAATWFVNVLLPYAKNKVPLPLTPSRFASLLNCVSEKLIDLNVAKKMIYDYIENYNGSAREYIQEHNIGLLSEPETMQYVDEYIANVPISKESIRVNAPLLDALVRNIVASANNRVSFKIVKQHVTTQLFK